MIYLGLGSNIADKVNYIKQAIDFIERHPITVIQTSSLYQSAALLPPGAPKEWDMPFVNAVIAIKTPLSCTELLDTTQTIEQQMGRKDRGKWGPREIDIDIIAYHDQIIQTDLLHVPHPLMHQRSFVLQPLAEIAPNWHHPVLDLPISDLSTQQDNNQTPCTIMADLNQPLS